ncbi:MAG: aspartate dehydrogenase [Lachnospiraceae bacterium]|nr:aspartate dehydrogenase [Lachnospiraceae bacterium]
MFGLKKRIEKKSYDRENMKPILHASICTGETVAGFKDKRTGRFEEIMLIKNEADKELFKEIYDITSDLPTEY